MKEQIAKLLKLDPNAADDVIVDAIKALVEKEASALAEVQNRANELKAKTTEAAELKNRAEAAEAKVQATETARIKAETDTKVTAELAKYPDLANRAEAEQMLRADFDKGAAFLASLKIPSKVPGKNPDTEDLANRQKEGQLIGYDRVAASLRKD